MLKIEFIGTIGRDAEEKEINGSYVTSFTACHTEKWKDKNTGEKKEKVFWVKCEKWANSQSKLVDFLKKGAKVYCSGMPIAKAYISNGGESVGQQGIRIKDIEITKFAENNTPQQQPEKAQEQGGGDDLPF